MFAVTGQVTSTPSAWRGEATKSIPKRLESKTTLPSALTSTSHPLQPHALTCRSRKETDIAGKSPEIDGGFR